MHTLRMTLAGLALLAIFVGVARFFPHPSRTVPRAAQVFVPVWAIVAVGNMLIGMIVAGIPFRTELAVLAVVFGIPAATAWFLGRRM
jgi:hypothetical protein